MHSEMAQLFPCYLLWTLAAPAVALGDVSLYRLADDECLESSIDKHNVDYVKSYASMDLQEGTCADHGFTVEVAGGSMPLHIPFVSEPVIFKRMKMSQWDAAKLKAQGFLAPGFLTAPRPQGSPKVTQKLIKNPVTEASRPPVARGKLCAYQNPVTGNCDEVHSDKQDMPMMNNIVRTTSPDEAVIIFDWDDTLMPTTFIRDSVVPSLHEDIHRKPLEWCLPKDSPYYDRFEAHARVVEETLRAARKVARVAIVTLAREQWVKVSSNCWLPGIDFKHLSEELDLDMHPVDLSSRVVWNGIPAHARSGNDPTALWISAKKFSMSKTLEDVFPDSIQPWNVLSVGDSTVEQVALQQLCADAAEDRHVLCKTLKLKVDPTISELTEQLKDISQNLHDLVTHEDGFDRTTEELKIDSKPMVVV
jgi:hypothetical protein